MKIKQRLYWLTVAALAITLLVSSGFVARYVIDALQQKDEYDSLAAMVDQARSEAATAPAPEAELPAESVASTLPAAPAEPSILPEYAPLYEKNSDMVGWMTIDGTVINYPVMQSPDRVDYYLDHNFSREKNSHGCLYVRETCDVFTPSDNVTIYGHHMKDGSMFTDLKHFLSQSFWEEHHTITFDTLYEHHSYTVFAVFTTTATLEQGFPYHRFENAQDAEEFDEFIRTCKEISAFDTGITPQYGDKIICLSTCEYSQTNGRLVVAALRNTESPNP